jgi:hypothetical protein
LDTWKIDSSEEYDTGRKILNDVIDDDYKIEQSDEESYLGDLITCNGKNGKNMAERKSKGIGIVDNICSILKDVFFGPYFFQTALVLRESLLLNSILLNSESWYNLTTADIKELEHIDNVLHRRILETPVSTPISILHLILIQYTSLTIKYLIKSCHLLYLQYILKQDKDSLMYKVFEAQ